MGYSADIELVPFRPEHFDLLIRWTTSAEFLLQWAGSGLDYPLTRDQLDRLLRWAAADPPATYLFSVRRPGESRVIGHAEIGRTDPRLPSVHLMRLLIGPPELRGHGLGLALVRELVRYSFQELSAHRVSLSVFEANAAAIRCYEKAGFRLEGTLREARSYGGRYLNLCVMAILRSEWTPDPP